MTLQISPYLRVQRNFPQESTQALTVELDRAYIDTAQKVNERIIGLFAVGSPIVTGERWFLTGSATPQQTLRQIYTFTTTGNIPHGIDFSALTYFTRMFGAFTNGTNWYPLPYVDVANATNQVNFILTPTNIVISAGGGAPPAITSGIIDLEWLSNF
jgi:hypothetical protein